MAGDTGDVDITKSKFQRFGLGMALLFYLISVVVVHAGRGRATTLLDPDLKVITVAHGNLEDGYREGMDEIIREFEAMKAAQGEKVKVVQSTVPARGYTQWFMTQLIGGKPADVIRLAGTPHLWNQYFEPFSRYVGKPNRFNIGTPLEGVPWRDTFVDGMETALDPTYAEYFWIAETHHTLRLFVNMDLLEKATGSRKLPEDFTDWVDICAKMKAYGEKIGKPIIPIGVNGIERSTLKMFWNTYLCQTNSYINDEQNLFCVPASSRGDIFSAFKKGLVDKDRFLAVVDLIRELGQYFGEGFTSLDMEQARYLFFSGLVGFLPAGSYAANSIINNSPFEVEVLPIPPLGYKHKYSK